MTLADWSYLIGSVGALLGLWDLLRSPSKAQQREDGRRVFEEALDGTNAADQAKRIVSASSLRERQKVHWRGQLGLVLVIVALVLYVLSRFGSG